MKSSISSNVESVTGNHELFKYKAHYSNLLKSYQELCERQKQLSLALHHDKGSNESMKMVSIDGLFDAYALKVAKKKDTYEKISTLEGICEGNDIFLIKRWKRKCRFMLEIIAELYKNYLDMHEEFNRNIPSESDIELAKTNVNIIVEHRISRTVSTEFDKWDILVTVSEPFLNDLITNFTNYKNELNQQILVKERLFYVLKRAKDQRARLKIYVNNLRDEIRYAEKKLRETAEIMNTKILSGSTDDVSSMIEDSNNMDLNNGINERTYFENRIYELEKIIKEEETRRKHLHNKFQELLGNIRVYCRIRPSDSCCLKVSHDDKLIVPIENLSEKLTKTLETHVKCFIFDKVFPMNADQESVFGSVDSLITSCVDGYNVCIMAYGQTGSGKTFTMVGSDDNPGINKRAIQQLLTMCSTRNQWKYSLTLSMSEIYQEEIYDLLKTPVVPETTNPGKNSHVKVFSNKDSDIVLHGLSEREVEDEAGIYELLKIGEINRNVGSTLLNISSSRSHLILFIKIKGISEVQGITSRGTLTLCDLAGSENIFKAGTSGTKFQEATSINKSLTTLGRVFDSLRKNQKPAYRDSKLTHILKPTLGGDSKCLLLVNVRSESEHVHETLGALYFGQNAMQVIPEKSKH